MPFGDSENVGNSLRQAAGVLGVVLEMIQPDFRLGRVDIRSMGRPSLRLSVTVGGDCGGAMEQFRQIRAHSRLQQGSAPMLVELFWLRVVRPSGSVRCPSRPRKNSLVHHCRCGRCGSPRKTRTVTPIESRRRRWSLLASNPVPLSSSWSPARATSPGSSARSSGRKERCTRFPRRVVPPRRMLPSRPPQRQRSPLIRATQTSSSR